MRYKFQTLAVVGLVTMWIILAAHSSDAPRDPSYKGKRLSQLVESGVHRTSDIHPLEAMEIVALNAGPEAVPFLLNIIEKGSAPGVNLQSLSKDDPSLKRANIALSMLRLMRHKPKSAIPSLVDIALDEKKSHLTWDILHTLMFIRIDSQQGSRLIPFLADPDAQIRHQTASTLSTSDSGIIPHLLPRLNAPTPQERAAVAWALRGQKGEGTSAVPGLKKLLTDTNSEVRLNALNTLIDIISVEPDELRKKLTHPDEEKKRVAREKITKFRKSTLNELRPLLDDPEPEITIAVMRVFASFEESAKPAVPIIAAKLSSKHERERSVAADTLSRLKIHAVEAVPQLAKALGDSYPGVRSSSALALERMGAAASPALPALKTLSIQKEVRGSRNATRAIEKIEAALAAETAK